MRLPEHETEGLRIKGRPSRHVRVRPGKLYVQTDCMVLLLTLGCERQPKNRTRGAGSFEFLLRIFCPRPRYRPPLYGKQPFSTPAHILGQRGTVVSGADDDAVAVWCKSNAANNVRVTPLPVRAYFVLLDTTNARRGRGGVRGGANQRRKSVDTEATIGTARVCQ